MPNHLSIPAPLIGVIVNNVGGYSRAVIRGIASFAVARTWRCRVQGVNEFNLTDRVGRFDGIIAQAGREELQQLLERSRAPVVNVSSAITAYVTPSVVTDDRAVGRLGADYFLRQGHRRLVFYAPDDRQFALLRQDGFIGRCREGGRASGVQAWAATDPTALRRLLDDVERPVAVMGCNDRAALAVLDLLREMNLRSPDQVAVLGVDNDDLVQAVANPPLSTINTARERIGFEAASLLERLMNGERATNQPILIPPRGVITRRSSDALAVPDAAVAEAVRYITANAGRRIGVDDVAEHVTISRRQLERRFRASLGRSILDELQRCRIDRARGLLLDTDLTLAQVADASGFGSASYFTVAFRSAVGETPGRFRARLIAGA